MRTLAKTLLVLGSLVISASVAAQDYPSKPLSFILPTNPGGSAELSGRLLGERITELTGQPVVVEAKPGASGNIAAEYALKAEPDGHTMFMGYGKTHSANVHMFKNLTYDPVEDFKPVSFIFKAPYFLFVKKDLPVQSVAELIEYAKAHPGELSYGSGGLGDPTQLAAVLLNLEAGLDIVHVPYNGIAAGVQDLAEGRIDIVFATGRSMPSVESGDIRVIGVTYVERESDFPDVPAIAETLPGFEFVTWAGVFVSSEVPDDRVEKLNAIIVEALSSPAVEQRMASFGLDAAGSSAAELQAFVKADLVKFGQLIKAAGIEPSE